MEIKLINEYNIIKRIFLKQLVKGEDYSLLKFINNNKFRLKRKKWLINKNKKKKRRVSKKKYIIKCLKIKRYKHNNKNSNKINNKHEFEAPSNLSITENTEETLEFFNSIISEIKRKQYEKNFYFDFSEVTNISIDALMYILAILRNIKSNERYRYKFYGNQPRDLVCQKKFEESGFNSYVKSTSTDFINKSDEMQIMSGNFVDTAVAAKICNFVNDICGTKTTFTKNLYNTIIELMTNTVQHAYKDEEVLFVNQYYIFVENMDDKLKFIFLDTGEGIPSTINKNWWEGKFTGKTDSVLIESALRGQNRTETKEPHRGKGLPKIALNALDGYFSILKIYSDKGDYTVNPSNKVKCKLIDNKNSLFGTLFSWEIKKDGIGDEYKNDKD
ncbi:MAG: hypothetical protein ACRC7N_10310 [Clostridium sp.]